MRPRGARWVLVLAAAWTAGCGGPPIPRHVVLVTIDTLRADRLGALGYGKGITPHLDALAAEGTIFLNASTTVPLTGPAHSGMLTGRYPLVTGFRNNGTAILPPDETLLPEILRARGFRTGAVISCLVLSSQFGFAQGFDLFYEDDITSKQGRGLWFEERKADKTVDRALRWLRAEQGRPVFLWMHLFDPHHPYDPPGIDANTPVPARYDAEIAFADRELGRFFGAMKSLGMWDETLLIVAADHGESLGEHQEPFHGIFVYESTMHVPLIVRLPGAPGGRRVPDQASTLDVFPTVLDALGARGTAAPIQGVSLLDAVKGTGRVPARSPYMESIYGYIGYGWAEVRALRTPRWKYIDLPLPELYDLSADPREMENLARTQPGRAEEVGRELRQMLADLEGLKQDVQAAALDDEMRERLLSLGYIADTASKLRHGEPRDPKEVAPVAQGIIFASHLIRASKMEEAERVLREVLRQDPHNKMGLMRFGRVLSLTDRVDEGVAALRKAISYYPDSEELYRVLGWVLINNGRTQEAIALFSEGLEAMPSSASVLYLYGFANFRAGLWDRALEALGEALKLNSREAKAYYLTGVCQEQLGRRDEAYASFETYLRREADVESLFRDPFLSGFRADPRFAGLVKRYL